MPGQRASNREFCRQNGISEKSYYYWLRKLHGEVAENMAPQLVRLGDKGPGPDSMIHIQFQDAQLVLPGGTDVDAIAAVLRSFQQL